ncbi:hypothetical protein [Marinovum sp.]|uniref:hypothetical protein n=1 Tax=Marinovum sp. TaxID=2024839 RepID=UPI002B26D4E4|nr:hypothetical protein [Marinovum sp.]
MTTANHFMTVDHTQRVAPSPATIARWFTRVVGLSLLAFSLGMWISPGATTLPELMMMKLCASFFSAVTGGYLLYCARTPKPSEG